MDSRASRPGFSLEALIAEAKRRARQRRLLVVLLVLAIAVAVAAVVLGSRGGGSGSGGPPSGLSVPSDGSQSVQIGAFALTVPRGFYQEQIQCPIRHCRLSHGPIQILVSNHPLTAASSPVISANRVFLDLSYVSPVGLLRAQRLPLNLHKLKRIPGQGWSGFLAGGGLTYGVHVFEGSKAPPAARASVVRALGSIRRAG